MSNSFLEADELSALGPPDARRDEYLPPKKNESAPGPVQERPAWNRRLIKFNGTHPALVSLTVVAPPQFLFVLVYAALTTLTVEISYQMHTTVDHVQWIQHAETVVICSFSIISNRIHAFFGQYFCYILSAWLVTIGDMMIFFVHKSYSAVLALRAVSAIGFALNLTATTPMSNQLIPNGKIETCLSFTIVSVPAASIIATFAFPKLVTTFGWQYIFLVGGVSSMVHATYLSIFCPCRPMDRSVRLDVVASLLAAGSISLIVLGVGLLEKLYNAWICLVLVLFGIGFLILFYKRNQKIKYPLLALECFNHNTITFLLSYFFTCAGGQADTYFYSLIWQQIFGYSAFVTGILTGVAKAFCLLFIGVFTWVVKHCCIQRITTLCNMAYVVFYILKILCLYYFRNAIAIEVLYIINQLLFLQNQLAIMTYNTVGSPPKFGPISSTLVGFAAKFSWSLGIAFCLSIGTIGRQFARFTGIYNPEEIQVTGISFAHAAGILFFLIGVLFSSNIGVFLWERGRWGYADKKLMQFDTYDVLKVEIDKYLSKSKYDGSRELDDIIGYYANKKKRVRMFYAYGAHVQ